jgi:hypothetical protein
VATLIGAAVNSISISVSGEAARQPFGGDEQHWVLFTDVGYPRALVFPYARVVELNRSSGPQYGKYEWLLEEAVLRLSYLGFDAEVETKLRGLLDVELDGFFDFAKRGIERLDTRRGRPAR